MSEVSAGRLTQIYNAYRSALHNKKYYGCQLDFYRKLNRNVEIALAIVTPGTVGGWAIWFEPGAISASVTAEYVDRHVITTATSPTRRYTFYSPDLHLLAETQFTTATTRLMQNEYVWFNGQPLAQVETATGTLHYYFNDHLGAPILTTDSTGTIDWRVEREPYGSRCVTRVGLDRSQPLELPGQEGNIDGDRAYNIFRWYRSGWGRYTQVDPLSPGGEPHFDVGRIYRFTRPDVPAPGIDDDMARQWSCNEFPLRCEQSGDEH